MFKIKLSSFGDRQEFTHELKKGEISFENLEFEDGLFIEVALTKDGTNTVIVEGHIKGTLMLTCGRCLEGYKQAVDSDIIGIFKEKNTILQDDIANDVMPFSNNVIDLHDFLREAMLLELPLKPLCRVDCQGLCPVCGKNNNNEKCDCIKKLKEEETFKPFKKLDL